MEEAAVLESLAADVAEVRAAVVDMLAPVVFHDGVVFESHATLWTLIWFKSSVGFLVEAQGHDVWESLAALLAFKGALAGMHHHVLGNRYFELEILAA